MEELEFNRMIYAIVSGLYEKEQNNDKYPYSEHLLYGMNLFSALAFQQKQFDLLEKLNETSFITLYNKIRILNCDDAPCKNARESIEFPRRDHATAIRAACETF